MGRPVFAVLNFDWPGLPQWEYQGSKPLRLPSARMKALRVRWMRAHPFKFSSLARRSGHPMSAGSITISSIDRPYTKGRISRYASERRLSHDLRLRREKLSKPVEALLRS